MNDYNEQINEIMQGVPENSKNAGLLVRTKKGLEGRTYHNQGLVNGKQPVYINNNGEEIRMLCSLDRLTIIGFID